MKRLSLLSLLLAVLPLQAEMINCPQQCCQPCWDIEVYGEYLYWKVSEDQLQYAATFDVSDTGFIPLSGSLLSLLSTFAPTAGKISPTPLIAGLDLVDPDFQYNSGCRVGVGFNFGYCSNWQANLEYTRLHSTAYSEVSDFVNGVFPIDYPLLPTLAFNAAFDHTDGLLLFSFIFPDSVTNAFRVRYDTVDLRFGVSKQCSCFCARPYFGGKAAWIRQQANTRYLRLGFETATKKTEGGIEVEVLEMFSVDASLNKRNDFKAGGFELGADSTLKFWATLRLLEASKQRFCTVNSLSNLRHGLFPQEQTSQFLSER